MEEDLGRRMDWVLYKRERISLGSSYNPFYFWPGGGA